MQNAYQRDVVHVFVSMPRLMIPRPESKRAITMHLQRVVRSGRDTQELGRIPPACGGKRAVRGQHYGLEVRHALETGERATVQRSINRGPLLL